MEAARKSHRGNDRLLWCWILARRLGPGDWMVACAPVLGSWSGDGSGEGPPCEMRLSGHGWRVRHPCL